MTPSRYPAPPQPEQDAQEFAGKMHANSGETPALAGKMHANSGETPAQSNIREDNIREDNVGEGQEQEAQPSNIVAFPTSTTTTSDDDADGQNEQEKITYLTHQVAGILKLFPGDALRRIVQDYHADPSLSLLGEADAAREWIDDPQRNQKHKRMSPAFFRHWLQRERETRAQREAERTAASHQVKGTGTTGKAEDIAPGQGKIAPTSPGAGLASRSLMGLEAQYRRATNQVKKGENPS
jgi:hypothetical protein